MSTDKSAAAIREFAEKYGGSIVSGSGSIPILTAKEQCFSDLTALISEHYVSKEDVNQEVEKRIVERMPTMEETIDMANEYVSHKSLHKANNVNINGFAMKKGMKLFNVNFSPHYPVPSGLIIAATSEDQARDIAWETLEDNGLAHKNSMESLEIQEIKVEEPVVIFFESGMY